MASKPFHTTLIEFLKSDKSSMSLAAEYNPAERAELLRQCRRFNLQVSISSGNFKTITIAKKDISTVLPLEIGKTAHNAMKSFCSRAHHHYRNAVVKDGRNKHKLIDMKDERALRGCRLQDSVGVVHETAFYKSREIMPSYAYRKAILELLLRSQVVIVVGESGTGKTTQIPQYILEENVDRELKIVCIQPDQISTVRAAEIVAKQRDENVGFLVGYHIQLECKHSPHNCLLYCTPDIFIQTLVNNPSMLESINYLFIDEIHLRNRYIDFILVALKEHLEVYPNLKLILLSATPYVDIYKNYFNDCELLHIPAKGYQVQEFFIDDVLDIVKYESNDMLELMVKFDGVIQRCMEDGRKEFFAELYNLILGRKMDVNYQNRVSGYTPLMVAAVRGNHELVTALIDLGADVELQSWNGFNAHQLAILNRQFVAAETVEYITMKGIKQTSCISDVIQSIYHQTVTDNVIDYNLIVAIIKYIQSKSWDNLDVLVFLPSYDHIIECFNYIASFPIVAELKIVTLHSDMALESNGVVFQSCKGRKVILATTIAESSFHIGNVGYVVDSGRISMVENSVFSDVAAGSMKWISQLAADQRKAKVSFESNSKCFRLYTKQQYNTFNIANTSELLNCQLEDMCLRARVIAPQFSIEEYFDRLIEPPPTVNVKRAITTLKLLGVLDKQQNLTPLGENVVQFFVEPFIAKLLIYGVFLKCLDPILTLAAILIYKDIFIEATDSVKLDSIRKVIKEFSENSKSDHVALIIALTKYQDFKCNGAEEMKCKQYHMLNGIAESVLVTRASLLSQLRAFGYVSNGYRDKMSELNTYSGYSSVLKAALAASLYPRIALRCESAFLTRNELASLQPTSCLTDESPDTFPLGFLYQRFLKHNGIATIKYVTAVTPITIALFCGSRVSFDPEKHIMRLDKQVTIEVHSNQVWNFRTELDRCLDAFFKNPLIRSLAIEENLLHALFYVLNSEEKQHKLGQPPQIGRKPLLTNGKSYQYILSGFTDNYTADSFDNGYTTSLTSASSSYNFSVEKSVSASSSKELQRTYCGTKTEKRKCETSSNNVQRADDLVQIRILNEYFRMTCAEEAWGISSDGYHGNGSSRLTFFAIRPLERKNISISIHQGVWKFTAQTEKKIFLKYLMGDCVILLYSVRGSNAFQAVAQLKSTHNNGTLSCLIKWLGQKNVNYADISNFDIRNNILEDGYEFSYEIGLEIAYKMIYGEAKQIF